MSAEQESAGLVGALDVRDELAIAAIIEGKAFYEAAEIGGYSPRTLQRRQHDPEFKRRVAEVRNDRVAQIAGQLGSLVDEAMGALRRSLDNEDSPSAMATRPRRRRTRRPGSHLRDGTHRRPSRRGCDG